MKQLFFLVIAFICYGSLYPFHFFSPPTDNELIRTFFFQWQGPVHRGDLLANIAIFVPFGFLGWFSLQLSREARFSLLLIMAVVVGFGLQLLQFFLPSRDPSVMDGLLNLVGTLIGVLLAFASEMSLSKFGLSIKPKAGVPILLLIFWFSYKWMPFVPSLDWQQIKTSLKPLLLAPELSGLHLLHDITAWGITFLLLARWLPRTSWRYFIFVLPANFSAEILIIYNSISLSNLVGAVCGFGLWWCLKDGKKGYWLFTGLLMVYISYNGLQPFDFGSGQGNFHWIPFSGFLGNAMMLNMASFFEKCFFYGSGLWLLKRLTFPLIARVSMLAVFLYAIEMSQVYSLSHTAEITDPVLVVFLAACFYFLSQYLILSGAGKRKLGKKPRIKIMPLNRVAFSQIPRRGVIVSHTPFRIGRVSDISEDQSLKANHLPLSDEYPYQLSRNHFLITIEKSRAVIKDCNSQIGTKVNGITIGREKGADRAILTQGNNHVLVGKRFHFNIRVQH